MQEDEEGYNDGEVDDDEDEEEPGMTAVFTRDKNTGLESEFPFSVLVLSESQGAAPAGAC